MLNQQLKLNTKIFNENGDVEKISTRQGFGEGLFQAGIENENVVENFLQNHSDFKVVAPEVLKQKLGDENIVIRKNSLFLYPHLLRGDGQSICVFERSN